MSKTVQGHRTKLNKTKKRQNCRQSVVTCRQQLYCAVQSRSPNHSQTTTEKVQSSVHDDGAFLTDDGRLFRARAEATRKAWSPSIECLVNGTTSMAVSSTQMASNVDVLTV